jgi:EAL domain-containing protein (putative c-di-GMP-specific phosphodiesterase class I)
VRAEIDALLFARSALKLSQESGVDALLFFNVDRKRAAQIDEMLPAMMDGLRAARLTPFDISIEITEAGDAPCRAGLIGGVAKLRSLGFRIAIDDFGTGHSGLQTLYELQPDYVKN